MRSETARKVQRIKKKKQQKLLEKSLSQENSVDGENRKWKRLSKGRNSEKNADNELNKREELVEK